MKKIFLLIITYLISTSSWGQDKNVSGIIVSEKGIPVKNIKLSIVNLPISTKTNKNGEFILKKVRSEDSIVIHVNKKAYARFRLGDNDSLKLVLSNKTIALNNQGNAPIGELPIVSGTILNENSSPSIITSKMIERTNPLTIADAIKGQLAGVDVHDGYITMRGEKTLNMSNNSLIIVDGMEATFDYANAISVYDVECIEANKSGFGYGTKGACGVLIITTKKGYSK